MAQLIWVHGKDCCCVQCKETNDTDPHYIMTDSLGEQLVKATLPQHGDKAFYITQHGKRYVMVEEPDDI